MKINYNVLQSNVVQATKQLNLNVPIITIKPKPVAKKIQVHKRKSIKEISNNIKVAIKIYQITKLDIKTATIIANYSTKFNIDPALLIALIKKESEFKRYAISDYGARGYCQITPLTEKDIIRKNGKLLGLKYNPKRIYEPEYNLGLGVLLIYELKLKYNNDYHRILTEYNRGMTQSKKYYKKYKTYVSYYSKRVLEYQKEYQQYI